MNDNTGSRSAPFAVPDELPALDRLEAALVDDLVKTQGKAQAAPLSTALRIVLPVVAVVGGAMAMLPALQGLAASVVVVGLASLLALVGVAVAPTRPGAGERLAQLSIPTAVIGFALEVLRAVPGGVGGAGMCFTMTGGIALVAVVAAGLGLSTSGLPLRLWHRIGLGVVGVMGACTAVWHHCQSDELGHVMLAHLVGPLVLLIVVIALVRVLVVRAARRPLSRTADDAPPTV